MKKNEIKEDIFVRITTDSCSSANHTFLKKLDLLIQLLDLQPLRFLPRQRKYIQKNLSGQ